MLGPIMRPLYGGVAKLLSFANPERPLIFQGNFCRKSRSQKANFRD